MNSRYLWHYRKTLQTVPISKCQTVFNFSRKIVFKKALVTKGISVGYLWNSPSYSLWCLFKWIIKVRDTNFWVFELIFPMQQLLIESRVASKCLDLLTAEQQLSIFSLIELES